MVLIQLPLAFNLPKMDHVAFTVPNTTTPPKKKDNLCSLHNLMCMCILGNSHIISPDIIGQLKALKINIRGKKIGTWERNVTFYLFL